MNSPLRVLLVEDNPGDIDLIRETLADETRRPTLETARDGLDALERLLDTDQPAPDLILLDLNLPRMSGRELLAELKRHERLRSIPVVILSSSDAEQEIARSYELGAACYLVKPVGLREFQEVVRSVERFWLNLVRLP